MKFMGLIMIMMVFSTVFFFITMLFSMKKKVDLNKMSPFECGFNSRLASRTPFSLQFFLVSILFLIFDTELILIFPFVSMSWGLDLTGVVAFMVFFTLLSLSVFIEWNQKKLEWSK